VRAAALTAGALDAEAVAVAWSGRGVVRNYADEPGEPMPVLYERTLPARAESRWDFSQWRADAVVVNLGTNDFSLGRSPPREDFVSAYATLLRRIGAVYPGAPVFCMIGPMLVGEQLESARAYVDEALARLRHEGARPQLVEVTPQTAADGYGCDWHPSAKTHRRMAAELTPVIRSAMSW
jgi:hypothetical protein